MSKKILVTGGAGYIGSHAALALLANGWDPIILDNLSTGHQKLIPDGVPHVLGNVEDPELLSSIFEQHDIAGVMHFAGSIVVPESVTDPIGYYENNTIASHTLIKACVCANIRAVVFSSTAAVYGCPEVGTVSEDAPLNPINPYGRSKLMTEWMLEDASRACGLPYAALRYFNVAGADTKGRSGQAGPNSTHLLRIACETALGLRPDISIFGDDYDTEDGTCVRDYIHVEDLVSAHVLALEKLLDEGGQLVLNLGYGHGVSVKQAIEVVEQVGDVTLQKRIVARREGDPPVLIANADRAKAVLGWNAKHNDLSTIVQSSLSWQAALPKFFENQG
ncbi:MAG: UDP-glucose 4-epimerase GalE [Rhodospirillales bacterium]|jgi:UDP-glucose 4-epimerase|nr:UDP-glucose 4-epimerase GalE [Rhodospirillales bacterium]